VEHVLNDIELFDVPPIRKMLLGDVLGNGIFMVSGENWHAQRTMARPIFNVETRKEMFKVYDKCGSVLIDILNEHHLKNEPLEIQQLFKRFTLDTFGEIGFGITINSLSRPIPFSSVFDWILIEIRSQVTNPFWKFFRYSEWKKNLRFLDDFVYKIIQDRREEGFEGKSDFLSSLLQMEKSGEAVITDQLIRDQLMNFFLAGRDTTAMLISWTCYFLAQHPDVDKKLREEILSVVGQEKPTMQHTKQLKYLQMVLDESLRLLPPAVPINSKLVTRDTVLPNGARVKKGDNIAYSPYIVHRLKEYWGDDCEEFRPSRWENPDLIKHPYQFVPFQKGPRICLGMTMAYEEAKCCFVMLFQNGIHFKLVPNQKIIYQSGAILTSKDGIIMKVEKYGK